MTFSVYTSHFQSYGLL